MYEIGGGLVTQSTTCAITAGQNDCWLEALPGLRVSMAGELENEGAEYALGICIRRGRCMAVFGKENFRCESAVSAQLRG